MTNHLEVNNIFDANLKQNDLKTSTLLYESAYKPDQIGEKIKHTLEVSREAGHIGHGKFNQNDAKDFEKIYDEAMKKPGATRESVEKALQDRATELNEHFDRLDLGARVEVIVGSKGKGFKDGYYQVRVEHFKPKTGDVETVGFVKIGNPKNPDQPIEEKTSN
jgi:hypothetical protein